MSDDDSPDVVEALFDVEEGDEVLIETHSYAYSTPYTVTEIEGRVNAGENVRLIAFDPDSSQAKQRKVRAVEGSNPPVFGRGTGRIEDVTNLNEADDAWCGRCGRGFASPQLVKQHAGRVHDDTNPRVLDVEPDLECDDCGRMYYRQGKYQAHRNASRCGAALPEAMSEPEFRRTVAEVDTMLELDRAVRSANRSQLKKLLEERDLQGEIATAEARSPQALIEATGLDEDDPFDHDFATDRAQVDPVAFAKAMMVVLAVFGAGAGIVYAGVVL